VAGGRGGDSSDSNWLLTATSLALDRHFIAGFLADTSLIRRPLVFYPPCPLSPTSTNPLGLDPTLLPRVPSRTGPSLQHPKCLPSPALPEYMRRQRLPSSIDVTFATADVVPTPTYCFIPIPTVWRAPQLQLNHHNNTSGLALPLVPRRLWIVRRRL